MVYGEGAGIWGGLGSVRLTWDRGQGQGRGAGQGVEKLGGWKLAHEDTATGKDQDGERVKRPEAKEMRYE